MAIGNPNRQKVVSRATTGVALCDGEWPDAQLRFEDGNGDNCAIANLAYGEWDQITPEGSVALTSAHTSAKAIRDGIARNNLKRDFGISLEQYQTAFVAQRRRLCLLR